MGARPFLRQPPAPPPPHRQCHRDGWLLVEGNSEIGGCKRNSLTTTIESLPDELLLDILLDLMLEDINNAATLLLHRNWYRIIHTHDFIYAHLHRSTQGLLIQSRASSICVFAAIQRGKIEISKLRYQPKSKIMPGSNGLILQYDYLIQSFYITNPFTKQHFSIPWYPYRGSPCCSAGIGYSPSSMEYKVVHYYQLTDRSPWKCAIVTLGVDSSWRDVCIQHISDRSLLEGTPLITTGFMHWAKPCGTHVLTLDLETEVFKETRGAPRGYEIGFEKRYLSTGKSLSLLISGTGFFWEVWDMEPETGEWIKMWDIDLQDHECRFRDFRDRHRYYIPFVPEPAGWLKYGEVLVLHVSHPSRVCFVYNVLTREIELFELEGHSDYCRYYVHTNSLVWLAGS